MTHDFEARAAELLDAGAHGYFAGGAGDELTLRDNEASWGRVALTPRVLVDVAHRDTSVTLLGRERAHPFLVAPTAYQLEAHQDGETGTARAAAATGSIMVLSSQTTTDPREVAAAVGTADRWFQLYVYRDRGLSHDLVAAAREGGYEALVITVDFPFGGRRERTERSGFTLSHPPFVDGLAGPLSLAERHAMHDPTLTWDDIAAFGEASGLPVVLKGILHPADAARAVDAGVAGIVVSNHGGRQLDTVLSGADALGPVVEAVDGRIDVLVDGGIRRGWDAAKALALGADAVLVGRPVLWGLACEGAAGAQQALEQLVEEFDETLGLLGCPRARDLDGSYVTRRPS
ncbi:alpha-hydroxy acid oxidase [Aeromicrobium fastidiosum]|uniref:Alpha-hydroxy-acid oxidizing protein n=1 Tax=Aeromicrobium fastidiosum TaxID=52699 RepID=A0A641AQA2_9ACTN|nr:alpha-hydroxy acid oxidase [Aeromicrobium fastidiosum]KAA1380286.1 alpha-hydroxy-acid oxidizing protein [Aeromicrobium fastidiosum]MBP2389839.1 4-hydroxymandelate oxidase [Aeromicrobium fastidiosum]